MTLFSSYRLGQLELPNRIIMAPMTRSRALGTLPNELMATYYAQRATAGLIISEGIAPSPNGLGYARTPGLFSDEQVAGFQLVTSAVHKAGGRIFAQLMHVGRIAHPLNRVVEARVIAPSAVGASGTMWTDEKAMQIYPVPEAMNEKDIKETKEEFAQAALNALRAGFDGVELHGANGYLLEQFLHPHTNRRSDDYGGSPEKRARFVAEVVEGVARAIGGERVGLHLSPYNTFNDLPPTEETHATYAALVENLKGLAYLHVVRNQDVGFPETLKLLRSKFEGALILNGGFDDVSAEKELAAGSAELFSFARSFISNPDLVARFGKKSPLVAAEPTTFYTPGPEGYVDYPNAMD